MPYTSQVWASKYPKLAAIDTNQPYAPKGNQIYGNAFYPGTATSKITYQDSRDIRKKDYFEIRDNFLYARPGDFNNPALGDYRFICEAKIWAQQQHISQPPTLAEIGPHLPYGPTFNHVTLHSKTNSALRTDCHSSTVAPASHTPRGAFLNDGSRPNSVTDKSGCWLIVTSCPKQPNMVGKHRDTYGEQHTGALQSEEECLARASVQWRSCGSPTDQSVTAVFGPTGASTVAGDGCFMADYGCSSRGWTSAGELKHDTWAELHEGAAHDEQACLSRAAVQWEYCGKNMDETIVSIYRPTGARRIAGYGCWIQAPKCPSDHSLKSLFFDAWGDTNQQTGSDELSCFQRASDYWKHCGSDRSAPVMAHFRPKATSFTSP